MPTHAPLTPAQIGLLAEIEKTPLTLTIREQGQPHYAGNISFLLKAGLLNAVQTYIAQDDADNIYTFTRSAKPIDQ